MKSSYTIPYLLMLTMVALAAFGGDRVYLITIGQEQSAPSQTNLFITGASSITESNNAQYSAWRMLDNGNSNNVAGIAVWDDGAGLTNVTLVAGLVTVGDRDTTNDYTFTATYGGFVATNTISIVGTPEAPPVAQTLYPDIDVFEPAGITWAGFAAYDPPVTNEAPAANTPVVAENIRYADSGESVALTGTSMDSNTDYVVYGAGSTSVVDSVYANGYQQAVKLTNAPSDTMYMVWATNSNGAGSPFFVNQTEAWWAGPSSVHTGQTFSVYGANLTFNSTSRVWCAEEQEWLTSTSANRYKADYVVPSDWTNGTKTLYAHNGQGRKYGLCEAVSLTVEDKPGWSSDTGTWYWVTSYGATGNGSTDDFTSIDNAITAADSAGDWTTVYFPAGTYAISGEISGFSNVRLLGEDPDTTTITYHSTHSGDRLIDDSAGAINYLKLESLAFEWNTYGNATGSSAIYIIGNTCDTWVDDCHFKTNINVNIEQMNGDVFIANSRFDVRREQNVSKNEMLFVDNCDFYGANEVQYILKADGCDYSSVQNCTVQDQNSSTANLSGSGRFFYCNAQQGVIGPHYFGGNTITDYQIHTNAVGGRNTGEQWLCEFNDSVYQGHPSSVSGLTNITLVGLSEDVTGKGLAIASGLGEGQIVTITGYAAGTVTVSPALKISPDTNSIVKIGKFAQKIAIFNNVFDGKQATDITSAGCGVELYGMTFNTYCQSNSFSDNRRGISYWNVSRTNDASAGEGYNSYLAWNVFRDNTFSNNYHAIQLLDDYDQTSFTPAEKTTTHYGTVIANNIFTNILAGDIHFTADAYDYSTYAEMKLNIIDGNTFNDGLAYSPPYIGADTNSYLTGNAFKPRDYITFNGTDSYFETGFTSASDIKVEIECRLAYTNATTATLFGSFNFRPYVKMSDGNARLYSYTSTENQAGYLTHGWETIVFDAPNAQLIQNEVRYPFTASYSTADIDIGRMNDSSRYTHMDVSYVKIWDNGVLVADFNASNVSGSTITNSVDDSTATLVNCTTGTE